MSNFNRQLPEWRNAGVEPHFNKRDAGWQVDERPPADYLNWLFNKIYEALQELQEGAALQTVVDQVVADISTNVATNAANINLARTEKILNERLVVNDITADKLRITEDANRLKLHHLSDEVLQAITGQTSVNATPGVKSVTTEKIAPEAVTPFKLSDDLYDFDGHVANIRAKTGNNYTYVAYAFDTNGLTLTNGAAITAAIDVLTKEVGVDLAVKMFQSGVLDWSSGSQNDTNENGLTSIGDGIKFSTTMTGTRNNSYRYIKLYFMFKNIDDATLREFYVANAKCMVGGITLPMVASGLYVASGDSTLVKSIDPPFLVARKKDLPKRIADLGKVGYSDFVDGLFGQTYGYMSKLKANTGNTHGYAAFAFDTDGLTIEDLPIDVNAEVHTLEQGIQLSALMFQSNDISFGSYSYTNTNKNGLMDLSSEYNGFTAQITKSATNYRYIKIYFRFDGIDAASLKEFFIYNIKAMVGDVELPLVAHGIHSSDPTSTVVYDLAPFSVIKMQQTKSKWQGKKANFIGDSITAGAASDGAGGWITVKQYHQWLKEMLGLTEARNYGISSTCISPNADYTGGQNEKAFTLRYTDMDDDADLMVVFGGTNDFGHNVPLGSFEDTTDQSFYGALHVLMQGLINKYPGKRVVFMTPLHRNRSGDNNETNAIGIKLSQYVAAIKDVAGYYSIPIVDAYTMSGITPFVQTIYDQYINDGLHPNAAGHELFANNIIGEFGKL